MKCTNCGSSKLKETNFPLQTSPLESTFDSVVTYICAECGHYEFYNFKFVLEHKKKFDFENGIDKEINELKSKIVNLEEEYNKISKELVERKEKINLKLQDLDITVRTKLELEKEINELDIKLKEFTDKYLLPINQINSMIENLQTNKSENSKQSFSDLVG